MGVALGHVTTVSGEVGTGDSVSIVCDESSDLAQRFFVPLLDSVRTDLKAHDVEFRQGNLSFDHLTSSPTTADLIWAIVNLDFDVSVRQCHAGHLLFNLLSLGYPQFFTTEIQRAHLNKTEWRRLQFFSFLPPSSEHGFRV